MRFTNWNAIANSDMSRKWQDIVIIKEMASLKFQVLLNLRINNVKLFRIYI
jgi:hypothetical protein